ncbi:hypothetical protein D3C71_1769760 [compost metagenome]
MVCRVDAHRAHLTYEDPVSQVLPVQHGAQDELVRIGPCCTAVVREHLCHPHVEDHRFVSHCKSPSGRCAEIGSPLLGLVTVQRLRGSAQTASDRAAQAGACQPPVHALFDHRGLQGLVDADEVRWRLVAGPPIVACLVET